MSVSSNVFAAIVRREWLDLARDRKTIKKSLLAAVMLPVMVIASGSALNKNHPSQQEIALVLPVAGAEHAPELMAYLRENNVQVIKSNNELQDALLGKEYSVGLRVNDDFLANGQSSSGGDVELLFDASQRSSNGTMTRIQKIIAQYNLQTVKARLITAGVAPTLLDVITVKPINVANADAMRVVMLAILLPFLLSMTALTSNSMVIIDSTAGERERHSLEPLLATPASAATIMSGKLFVSCLFGFLVLAISLLPLKVAGSIDFFGLHMTMQTLFCLVLALLPLLVAGSTLLTWLSASAKSVREAQSYFAVMMTLPMLANVVMMIFQVKIAGAWAYAIPLVSQTQMIAALVREEHLSLTAWLINYAAHALVIGLFWLGAARRYSDERFAIS